MGLAAEVAFFFVLSLPPTLLAVFGSVGYIADWIGTEATLRLRTRILDAVSTFLSADAVDGFGDLLDTFLTDGRAGVASIGVVVALWSASRATRVFMDAVNIAYDLEETRSVAQRRAAALGITAVGIVGAVAVIPLLVAGPRVGAILGGPLGISDAVTTAWRVLYWPAVGLLGIGMLATFYHLATAWHTPWRRDLPGAGLAAVLWLAGAGALRLYVSLSVENSSAYGTLATPIAVLLWFYVTAIALLLGAELNAEIEKRWPTGAFARAQETSERVRAERDRTRREQAREVFDRVSARYRTLRARGERLHDDEEPGR